MKEIIFTNDFFCDGCQYPDVMENISMHCHFTPSDEIWIYERSDDDLFLACYSEDITYPKVTYAETVKLTKDVSLIKILPDIKKMGELTTMYSDIDDFGNIQEIGYFNGMSDFTNSRKRKLYNIKTKCVPLGNDMYRFTTPKGIWDIRVNSYD